VSETGEREGVAQREAEAAFSASVASSSTSAS
jgi:hypothetical protein